MYMMMALHGSKRVPGRRVLMICFLLPIILSAYVTSSHQYTDQKTTPPSNETKGVYGNYNHNAQVFYKHTWPGMKFGWRIIVGTIIGFLGSSFGTVGGVGGGGIFLPMLTLIIGFDSKSATAISKLISVNAFLKGVNTWKKETLTKKEARANSKLNDIRTEDAALDLQAGDSVNESQTNTNLPKNNVSVIENVYWKELGLLFSVWIMILALQIGKNYTRTCSVAYWILNLLQVPITVGVSSYEAVLLYKGKRVIASKGDQQTKWSVHQLIIYCACGIVAGTVAGLLGLGGGFILGPLFLELGIPPQVSSATSTFAMTFSASMSVVEYYLLKRFPIPYALYFVAVALVAALVGQYLVRKLIALSGRASVIIFILAFTLFVSGISLGGTGIADLIKRLENKEYMGFGNLCEYRIRN